MAKTSLGKVSVLPKGEYSSVIQYSRLDIVTYKGSSYLCIKDSLGIEITNEEYWQLLAQKGDTGETGATGAKGDKGDAGKDFSIYKTYPSISAMESDASNVPEGEFVLIASDVEDTDNAKLYVKSNTGFVYLTDLSGATGIKGEKGDKPINGVDYNTPEEKEEFKNEVVQNATVEVEQNIANIQEQAIQEFNSNASTKTNEYNSNTTTKLQEYNTNANTKIEEYNSNATQKTNTFNGNATTQIETFNNNATSKTNDFNSNASTKTEEFNAVVDAEKEQFAGQTEAINHHIAVVSDELERVKNDVLETGEESGSYITLNDSAMAEYQELSVDGVCEQKTTTGKNKLYIKEPQIYTENGISYTINQDLSITMNGNATANSKFSFINKTTLDNTKNYKVVIENFKSGVIEVDFATDKGNKYNYGNLENGTGEISFANLQVPQGTIVNNVTYKIQVIEVDQSSDYEPYTGGQPSPNPDYPQEIKTITGSLKITSCGKNFLSYPFSETTKTANGITWTDNKDGTITADGTANADASFGVKYSLPMPAGTFIYKTFGLPNDCKANYYFSGIRFGEATGMTVRTAKWNAGLVITIPKGVTVSNALLKPILVAGMIVGEYEQYISSQIEANLPKGEFIGKIDDTYKDTLKVEYNEEDGEYHLNLYKNVGKVVLDGSESWIENTAYAGIFMLNKQDIIQKYDGVYVISNYLLGKSNGYFYANLTTIDNSITNFANSRLFIALRNYKNNLSGFKTWLSNNQVTVYYALATPYVVDLGIVDMPITYNEVTNLFTDSDLMPTINAKYYRNFITTIQNLQVNEKALKEELVDINNRLSALESATTNVASESESEVVE